MQIGPIQRIVYGTPYGDFAAWVGSPVRETNKLNPTAVKACTTPGHFADGGGLYLFVKADGSKFWKFRYRCRATGRLRDKGLGPVWDVTLAGARKAAAECRQKLRDGIDPLDSAQAAREAMRVEVAKRKTFGDCCTAYIEAHRAGWRNAKHADQWRSTLDTYAATLLPLPVAKIDTALVLDSLQPHWASKAETMTRVRQRIEAVLDWATARGYRKGENPARWRGHLDKLLPKRSKVAKVQPRAAVAYSDVSAAMAELSTRQGLGALALRLQVLTATRPSEVAAARWQEFDLERGQWTIPGERMKANREHRVPLSPQAVALLAALPRVSEYVFPGMRGKPLNTASMLKQLQEVRPGMTAHGFRSTFRDWAADCTSYPPDLAEFALAHAIKDATVAAYLRSDMFEKRREMMTAWADFAMPERTK